jgi:DNA-binding beta-propeller fold protein YncE
LSFDAKLLESDTEHAFLRAYESGGVAPVGLRFLDGEGKLIVANSNRFGDSSGGISIIDLANAAVQHIPSGEFPRNITVAPDRGSAFITNYNARTLEVLTLHPSPGDTLR